MNALKLFTRILFPHLWATPAIAPAILGGGLAALGGLAGAFGGGGGGQNVNINRKLNRPFKQGIQDFMGQTPQNFFPDQTFADQSPFTQQGIQGLGNFSTQPSQDLLQRTIGGDFLGMSPELQRSVIDPAVQATNSSFSALGRFGSQANANETSAAGIRALLPFFEQERGRQQEASQLLPLAQQTQFQNQLQGGALQEGFQQQGINEQMARHEFNPLLNQLNQISPALNTANNQPFGAQQGSGSPVSGALGGALLGGQLANSFGLFGGGGGGSAGLLANAQSPLINNNNGINAMFPGFGR